MNRCWSPSCSDTKGAFTGADKRRRTLCRMTAGHCFDEIGDISPLMQYVCCDSGARSANAGSKSGQTISVDSVNCRHPPRSGGRGECWSFSPDLYYRLNVVIEMYLLAPASLLADHFLRRFAERNRKAVKGLYAAGDGFANPLRLAGQYP